jgi:Rrf2 family protein
MMDLALHDGEGPVTRAAIACRQDLSADYIAQLFAKLQNAELVKGVKGPGGGYILNQQPTDIRVGDIIRAVEGPIALVDCVGPDGDRVCEHTPHCITRKLWQAASNAISEVLNSMTLDELRAEACRLGEVKLVADCPK